MGLVPKKPFLLSFKVKKKQKKIDLAYFLYYCPAAEVRLGHAAGKSLGTLSATNEYSGPTFESIKCVPLAWFASQRHRQGRVN